MIRTKSCGTVLLEIAPFSVTYVLEMTRDQATRFSAPLTNRTSD
jgi:hypothetical protein